LWFLASCRRHQLGEADPDNKSLAILVEIDIGLERELGRAFGDAAARKRTQESEFEVRLVPPDRAPGLSKKNALGGGRLVDRYNKWRHTAPLACRLVRRRSKVHQRTTIPGPFSGAESRL
jgi:hypothetical protein